MNTRNGFIVSTVFLALLTLGLSGSLLYAAQEADIYSSDCRICHTGKGTPNLHHLLGVEKNIDCYAGGCHQLTGSIQSGYTLSNNGNVCFLKCHTPVLFRDDEGMLARLTPEKAQEKNWDISNSARSKTGNLHHQNYGAPLEDCGRCHEFYWEPDPGVQMTRQVEGSANEGSAAADLNNIIIVLENDQLVYDIGQGEELHVDASATQGDISAVKWSINNQEMVSFKDMLFFDYTFKWGYPGDTYVVKLEVWSGDGRYAAQNIGVNIL